MEVESVILLGLKKWASLSLLGTSVWGGMGGTWEGIYWLFSVFFSFSPLFCLAQELHVRCGRGVTPDLFIYLFCFIEHDNSG